jgi:hypothetical protein
MIYRVIIIILLGMSIQVNAQNSFRFSDKISKKGFIKEYLKADSYRADTELSEANIKKVVEKYVDKYRVDTNINDTIFILETRAFETRIFYGSLWSQQTRTDFVIPYKKKLKLSNHRGVFTEEEVAALLKWDKSAFISFHENPMWISPDWHYATRIIISNGSVHVERVEYLY